MVLMLVTWYILQLDQTGLTNSNFKYEGKVHSVVRRNVPMSCFVGLMYESVDMDNASCNHGACRYILCRVVSVCKGDG